MSDRQEHPGEETSQGPPAALHLPPGDLAASEAHTGHTREGSTSDAAAKKKRPGGEAGELIRPAARPAQVTAESAREGGPTKAPPAALRPLRGDMQRAEAGHIATLIAVAIIAGATALGTQLNAVFNGISGKLTTPT